MSRRPEPLEEMNEFTCQFIKIMGGGRENVNTVAGCDLCHM